MFYEMGISGGEPGKIRTEYAALYQGPNRVLAEVPALVRKGTPITVLERSGGWTKIALVGSNVQLYMERDGAYVEDIRAGQGDEFWTMDRNVEVMRLLDPYEGVQGKKEEAPSKARSWTTLKRPPQFVKKVPWGPIALVVGTVGSLITIYTFARRRRRVP